MVADSASRCEGAARLRAVQRSSLPWLALIGLLLVAGGGWWVATDRSPRRAEEQLATEVPSAPESPTGAEGPKWPPAELALSPHLLADPRLRLRFRSMEAVWRSRADERSTTALVRFLHENHEHRAALPLLVWLSLNGRKPRAAMVLLGEVHLRLGRLQAATAVFDDIARRWPNSWAAPYNRALVAFKRQDFETALAQFREAVERVAADKTDLGEFPALPRHGVGISLYRLGRPAEAVVALEESAKIMANHQCVHFDLMNSYQRLGRSEDDDREHADYWARRKDGANLRPIELTVAHDPAVGAGEAPRFIDIAAAMGLANEGRGRGSAWVDIDGDGDLDLVAGNLEETGRLWRSEDHGRAFTDITDAAGLGGFDNAYGLTFADYDNDGDPDLYVTRGGFQNGRPGRDGNLLFRNDGRASFTDVTEVAGVGDTGAGFSSVWADFDSDGRVDLHVVNNYSLNRLYRNRGDGSFEDATDRAGVAGETRTGGISSAVADYDDDGDLDIYVANNGEPNIMYRNEGGLRFTDVTEAAGAGQVGGFASVTADFDNDGDMDIYVSNMNNWFGGKDFRPYEPCYLLLNRGDGTFEEAQAAAGVDYVGGPMGLNSADLDYDGWVDLYLGNGGPEPRRWEPDVLYRNLGRGRDGGLRFANITKAAGVWNPRMGHGLSMADFDRDGDLDIYVPNGAHIDSDMTSNLFWRNEGHSNHWLVLRLIGTKSNRTAIGARATLRAGDHVQVAEVSGGGGFGAQGSHELEFGLGQRTAVDRLELRWPSGLEQTLVGPPIDRFLVVTEGTAGWSVAP